jgi:predicted HicB family RNase H-like nuclease
MTDRPRPPKASRNAPKYLLRIPPELNGRLRRLADDQGVSLNTLILMLLASGVGFHFESAADQADSSVT